MCRAFWDDIFVSDVHAFKQLAPRERSGESRDADLRTGTPLNKGDLSRAVKEEETKRTPDDRAWGVFAASRGVALRNAGFVRLRSTHAHGFDIAIVDLACVREGDQICPQTPRRSGQRPGRRRKLCVRFHCLSL